MPATMTRTISTHEATVHTAAVEVKTLTIRGKQVTLSVFRQLRDEPLIDAETGDLRGVPWGTVNYFWGDCAKERVHLHVVWQQGNELRRACVYREVPRVSRLNALRDDLGYAFAGAVVARLHAGTLNPAWAKENVKSDWIMWHHAGYSGPWQLPEDLCTLAKGNDVRSYAVMEEIADADPRYQAAKHAEHEAKVKNDRALAQARTRYGEDHAAVWKDPAYVATNRTCSDAARAKWAIRTQIEHEQQRRDAAQQSAAWLEGETDPAIWDTRIKDATDACDAFVAKWAQQYDALAALPQLFIAV